MKNSIPGNSRVHAKFLLKNYWFKSHSPKQFLLQILTRTSPSSRQDSQGAWYRRGLSSGGEQQEDPLSGSLVAGSLASYSAEVCLQTLPLWQVGSRSITSPITATASSHSSLLQDASTGCLDQISFHFKSTIWFDCPHWHLGQWVSSSDKPVTNNRQ